MALAQTYYAAQTATVVTLLRVLARLWARVSPTDIFGSWAQVLEQVVLAVMAAQTRQAQVSTVYIPAVVRGDGLAPQTDWQVVPAAFAGRTSAGVELARVLSVAPAVVVRAQPALSPDEALKQGLATLKKIAHTEVADVGREVAQVAMMVEPEVIGYERYVSLPACGRCIILAGRIYPKSRGFARHPQCNCTMYPVTSAYNEDRQVPRDLFNELTPLAQDRAFGLEAAQAVRDGGDISRAGNAARLDPSDPNRFFPGRRVQPITPERQGAVDDALSRYLADLQAAGAIRRAA